MSYSIRISSRSGEQITEIADMPDSCPNCHYAVEPKLIGNGWIKEEGLSSRVELVFRCPRTACERFFIAVYRRNSLHTSLLSLQELRPIQMQDADIPEQVEEISPTFATIYDEAQKAEAYGLKLVCGPGYRKALEFLVKDYVCASLENEEAREAVKKTTLAAVIRDHVTNENIVTTAARAAWLGNDETHYVRKWEEKDLKDLKGLIALTVHWIEMERLTNEIKTDMPNGR